MDLEAGARPALSGEAPRHFYAKEHSESGFRPEFFVVVATTSTASAPQQTVIPPPDPEPADDTDWGFFWLGWVFALSWVIGCFRPLCRQPRFPQKQNFTGWVANVIGKQDVTVCWFMAS
ncbi:hypothetical protein ABBQ32_011543 [Trebouxia sp. C0010 RCD-2024]